MDERDGAAGEEIEVARCGSPAGVVWGGQHRWQWWEVHMGTDGPRMPWASTEQSHVCYTMLQVRYGALLSKADPHCAVALLGEVVNRYCLRVARGED